MKTEKVTYNGNLDYSGLGDKKRGELTLEDLKPRDREGGYPIGTPRWLIRFAEILPGFVTWTLLLLPFITALIGYPELVIYYISFLTFYWTYRGLRFIIGLFIGYRRMQRDTAINWVTKIDELPNKREFKYILLFPLVKEGIEVIKPSLDAWVKQDIGSKKISLIIAAEERFYDELENSIKIIEAEYSNYFREIVIYKHRNDIDGEVKGVKGANINWATRHFVREIQKRGESINDYLLMSNDCDFRPHPKYLSAITYKYLTTDNPDRKYYTSAVYMLTNNLWRVPLLVRTQSAFLSLVILSAWVVEKWKRDSFSAYVASLKTVIDVGYWDPAVGIDDTTFYWNGKVRFAGDFRGEEVYLPVSNDAVENATTLKTYHALYRQQHRWGAGVITFPMTVTGIWADKKISLLRSLTLFSHIFDAQVFMLTVVYLITFALPILSWLSPEYNYSAASVILPKLMSTLFTALMFINIPVYILKRKLLKPPKSWSPSRILLDIFEILMITVNMLTFTFIPFLQAQTELLFGKGFRKEYYATEKVKTTQG